MWCPLPEIRRERLEAAAVRGTLFGSSYSSEARMNFGHSVT